MGRPSRYPRRHAQSVEQIKAKAAALAAAAQAVVDAEESRARNRAWEARVAEEKRLYREAAARWAAAQNEKGWTYHRALYALDEGIIDTWPHHKPRPVNPAAEMVGWVEATRYMHSGFAPEDVTDEIMRYRQTA